MSYQPVFFVGNTGVSITRAIVDGANPFDDLKRILDTMPGGLDEQLLRGFTPGEVGGVHTIDLTRKYLETGGLRSFFGVGIDAFKQTKGNLLLKATGAMREWHSAMEAAWRTRLYVSHLDRQLTVTRRLYEAWRAEAVVRHGLGGGGRQGAEGLGVCFS